MATCQVCQATTDDNAEFCPDCGTALSPPPPAPPAPAAPPPVPVGPAPPPAPPDEAAPLPAPPAQPPPAAAAALGAASAKLSVVRAGVRTGDVFPLAGTVVVGRFDPATGPVEIDLGPLPEGAYASRHHAQLWTQGSQWFVKDLGSSNGTFVRPAGSAQFEPVKADRPLNHGDEVAIGNARFVFETS